MMREHPVQSSTQVIIGASTVLLGMIMGVGTAFGLWSQLHHTAEPAMLTAAVVALATGLALVGIAVQNTATRLFLVVAAGSLALAFFSGGGAFASLTS
jgi:hypothetical protein